jgi:acetyl esterase/lipase
MSNPELNVHYDDDIGHDPDRCLDIWLATPDGPNPLVVFYHGGGFRGGDKSMIYGHPHIRRFREKGVSFATVNYRTDCGMRTSLCDCARAIQFLRHKGEDWRIDKNRVGAYGTSAGGSTSLWLAFSDDMADPYCTDDEVLHESTRLTVAGALSGQATLDLLRWHEILDPAILGIDIFSDEDANDPEWVKEAKQVWQGLLESSRDMYGLAEGDDLCSCEGTAIRHDLDFLARMSGDAPPIFVRTRGPASLTDLADLPIDRVPQEAQNRIYHNPLHAKALWERAREVGLEARVYAPYVGLTAPCEDDLVDFFLWHLLAEPDLCPPEDIPRDIQAVAQDLMALEAKLAAPEPERRQKIADYFDAISKCLSAVYASLQKNQVPHDQCAELEGYAQMLPATVGKEIGEEKAQELSKRFPCAHPVEWLWEEFNDSPDKAKNLPKIEEASHVFAALAKSVRAGLESSSPG